MTLADMVLAHDIIGRIGVDLAVELLDVIDDDAVLRPELLSLVQQAAKLVADELGDHATATVQLREVLQRSHGWSSN